MRNRNNFFEQQKAREQEAKRRQEEKNRAERERKDNVRKNFSHKMMVQNQHGPLKTGYLNSINTNQSPKNFNNAMDQALR